MEIIEISTKNLQGNNKICHSFSICIDFFDLSKLFFSLVKCHLSYVTIWFAFYTPPF